MDSARSEAPDVAKLPRCPRGTRRNRKTGECEKKDGKRHTRRLTIVDVLPEQAEPQITIRTKRKRRRKGEAVEDKPEVPYEENEYEYLYPTLDDPLFNKKIAERQEFYDTRYVAQKGDVRVEGDKLCNAEFELAPHQMFVRNFMSFQTPYNSLLLYHGLGSGKTCSAISVAEEMRDYMKQMGISQRILVVASPNVQDNFKLQLFDERKLEQVDGLWNIRACTGNKFLKEINPMAMKGLAKDRVVMQVKRIISWAYLFMGYIEFANYVEKKSAVASDVPESKRAHIVQTKLRRNFGNRLIIIDEVHNIRMTEDNKDKRVAVELEKLVSNVPDLRLLLLSATPMYNSYKESVWLINLMNKNDGRSTVEVKDVFDSTGGFKLDSEGREIGRDLLMRKATGYVSFMRGDNPYTFPFRIWPDNFSPTHTFRHHDLPSRQLNGSPILENLEMISVYLTETGRIQQQGYDMIIESLKAGELGREGQNMPTFEDMESFGYTLLQRPLEALNLIYPILGEMEITGKRGDLEIKDLVGKGGLDRVMSYTESVSPPQRFDFEYRPGAPRMFAPDQIGNYSGKIRSICGSIVNSTGVVLVYSQYIDGGVVPIALALEEMGFSRAGSGKSLLKNRPTRGSYLGVGSPPNWTFGDLMWENLNRHLLELTDSGRINATTPYDEVLRHLETESRFKVPEATGARDRETRDNLIKVAIRNATVPMRYAVITGDKALSPDNVVDLKAVTNSDNKEGDKVRVIIISQAGSEGLDFKFIRQVHVLEPWYNMNRIEQIIGRAVRTCSHKDLPFEERNVELYLHGSLMEDNDEEAADIYVYRLAEAKAVQIGRVSRALKEVAVDCILNSEQLGFTVEDMDQTVAQQLSTGEMIEYRVGDKPYSAMCDYMERCSYSCRPTAGVSEKDVRLDTYEESFILMNTDKIMQRVRDLMKERYFYRKMDLLRELTSLKNYPKVQIDAALTQLVEDQNEYITDRYGRIGHLVNISDLYLFQPLEINNKHISTYDRSVPLEWKRDKLTVNLPDAVPESILRPPSISDRRVETSATAGTLAAMKQKYETATSPQTIGRGEEDWYKFCSVAIDHMVEKGTNRTTLEQFVVDHIVDELPFDQSYPLLNDLEVMQPDPNSFEGRVLSYMTRDVMSARGLTGLLMDNMGAQQLLVRRGSGAWGPAEPEDYVDLEGGLRDYVETYVPLSARVNVLVGFMTNFKKEFIIFKTRDFSKKRTQGARCDQATKAAGVKTMNQILGEDQYATSTPISKRQLCVMQEFTLRLYNRDRREGKIWFLTPVQATITNVEKASF